MHQFKIPYYKSFMKLDVPKENLAGVLESRVQQYKPQMSEKELINFALDNPIGSPRLEELVKGKDNIVIVTSDHTRPVPSRVTIPIILERIHESSPRSRVTILLATGFHRPTTRDEMVFKFGREVVENENIINHDCRDDKGMVSLGVLPSGADLYLNRLAIEADLLIAEGFIEPHFFAGFSGGRKSILPGVAGEKTIMANHCSRFIAHEDCRTGILEGNPMHLDMLEAMRRASLKFILNVVIDQQKKIIHAVAGDPEKAHSQGCDFVKGLAGVKAVPADIIITSNGGYPLDQNIYQAVKGLTAAEATAKEGAVIIIACSCIDGHGGESFYKTFRETGDAGEVMRRALATSMDQTVPDQWESQILARVLIKHQVIVVTDKCDPRIITNMKMKHAFTLNEALGEAFSIKGRHAKITVIPDGVAIIVG